MGAGTELVEKRALSGSRPRPKDPSSWPPHYMSHPLLQGPRQGACSPKCLLVAPPHLVTEGPDQAFQILLLMEDHLLLLVFLLQLHFQLAELWAQRADPCTGEMSSLWTNPTRQGPSPGGGDDVESKALHPVPQRLPW